MNDSKLTNNNILHLPVEIHLDIIDLDPDLYKIWPLLSKYTAMTTRFDDKLERHGTWQFRLEQGGYEAEVYYQHGQYHGEYKRWYHSNEGQLHMTCTYINGKQEGEYKEWHVNGVLRKIYNCIDGKREGEYKKWYFFGQLRTMRV